MDDDGLIDTVDIDLDFDFTWNVDAWDALNEDGKRKAAEEIRHTYMEMKSAVDTGRGIFCTSRFERIYDSRRGWLDDYARWVFEEAAPKILGE